MRSDGAVERIEAAGSTPQGVELRALVALAAPAVAAKVSHLALGFTDFVMVSWLGTDATAAISPSTFLVYIVLCLGMGTVTSVQTFAAQALGRGEAQRAAPYVWQSLYIGLVFVAMTWPLNTLVTPFWTWVDHPPAVREMEISYCRAAFWSMGPAIICFGLEGFFNGIQRTGVVLVSVLVAIVFNAVADYVLIFGEFGCPALGIQGAAIATAIAWTVRAAIMMIVFLSDEMERTFASRRGWLPDAARLKEIFALGGPIAIQWVLDLASWFVFLTWMMARLGTAALAASNIALQYMHLSFMPAIGVGVAVSSLVGHAIGAGRIDAAIRHARNGVLVMMSYMIAVGLVYLFARYPLMRLLSSDAVVIAAGAGILVWAAVFQAFDAMCINYVFALRGAGDTRWPSLLVIFHCWVVFILGGQAAMRTAPGLGLHGPWMMCTLYIMLLGLALWMRWRRGSWKQIKLFGAAPAEAGPDARPAPVLVAET